MAQLSGGCTFPSLNNTSKELQVDFDDDCLVKKLMFNCTSTSFYMYFRNKFGAFADGTRLSGASLGTVFGNRVIWEEGIRAGPGLPLLCKAEDYSGSANQIEFLFWAEPITGG